MPMPTPPGPGEEPTNEGELYRYHFKRLITWYLEALDPLPPEAFTWTPPAPGANNLSALCFHAIGSAEWWTLSCVGDGPIERNRDDEFAATDLTWSALRPRFTAWLAAVDDADRGHGASGLPGDQPPPGGRPHEPPLLHTRYRAPWPAPGAYRDHD